MIQIFCQYECSEVWKFDFYELIKIYLQDIEVELKDLYKKLIILVTFKKVKYKARIFNIKVEISYEHKRFFLLGRYSRQRYD